MNEVGGGGASEGASDEGRAEAEKFNEMVDEGKLTPAEASSIEKDKTPDSSPEQKSREEVEAERKMMEKVIDVNRQKVAFNVVTGDYGQHRFDDDYKTKLKSVLRHGILGTEPSQLDEFDKAWRTELQLGVGENKINPEDWITNVRKRRSFVPFSITLGNNNHDLFGEKESFFIDRPSIVAILFDISKFQKGRWIASHELEEDFKPRLKTYYPDNGSGAGMISEPYEDSEPLSDYGYVIPGRIAPHLFRGMLLTFPRRILTAKQIEDGLEKWIKNKEKIRFQDLNSDTKERVTRDLERKIKGELSSILESARTEFDNEVGGEMEDFRYQFAQRWGEDPNENEWHEELDRFKKQFQPILDRAQGEYDRLLRERLDATIQNYEYPIKPDESIASVLEPNVFEARKEEAREEMTEYYSLTEQDKRLFDEQLLVLISMQREVYKGRENMMVPIYDSLGNLLWPQRMTHEQVKQFVAERDKKKAEEGEESNTSTE